MLANLSLWYDWDQREVLRQLERAIVLKPSDSLAHSCYAFWFASLGRSAEAIARARRAIEIDPPSLWVNSNLAVTLYLGQRYREAIDRCRAILEMAPNYSEAFRWMALSHFRLREWPQA
ncbi:MAG: tetratricopeptide repeat protein [Gemmatimonadota bacterium]|nr:tetratricopeptide repeat protein [Gemmatimonadota bacterium]